MHHLVFAFLFLIMTNWFQLYTFIKILVGPSVNRSTIKDSWISNVIKKKTGLTLPEITLFHDKSYYGMMAGLSFWPKLILSKGLYKSFNKDELEWVILHEAGHCLMWHNLQAALIEAVFLVLGFLTVSTVRINWFYVPIISVLFSILSIQVIRWLTEYQADKFAISKVDNPRGVITAQDKFRKSQYQTPLNKEGSLLRFLLHWNITPTMRVEMAKKRV